VPDNARVRIFIDFWNFQLQWNNCHSRLGTTGIVQIPWKDLPAILTAEAAKGQPAKFAGAHVYASVDPDNKNDKNLSRWLHHGLASITGYRVEVKNRKLKGPIRCQEEQCRAEITTCPSCKKPLRATGEKGIDAAVITDLLSMAFDGNYDIGVLVSGDADYAPAVEYIQKKTDRQIVQAFFKAHGDQLRTACWDHIFFEDLFSKLDLAPVQKTIVSTSAIQTPAATAMKK
jgi:uncharacterized LabA/DUF88 family protein